MKCNIVLQSNLHDHSLTPSLARSFARSLARSLTHSLTHSLSHSLTHSLTHSLILYMFVCVRVRLRVHISTDNHMVCMLWIPIRTSPHLSSVYSSVFPFEVADIIGYMQ